MYSNRAASAEQANIGRILGGSGTVGTTTTSGPLNATTRPPTMLEGSLNELGSLIQEMAGLIHNCEIELDRLVGPRPQPCGAECEKDLEPSNLVDGIRQQIRYLQGNVSDLRGIRNILQEL